MPVTGGMKEAADELGVIYALIERFEKQRLPRLLELKKRVDKGEVFSESDIRFMYEVTLDAQRSKRLIDRHPEWQEFCAEVIHPLVDWHPIVLVEDRSELQASHRVVGVEHLL